MWDMWPPDDLQARRLGAAMRIDEAAPELSATTSERGRRTRRAGLLACLAIGAIALAPTAAWAAKKPQASLTVAPITGSANSYVVTVVNTGQAEITGFEFAQGSPESASPPKQLVPSSACAFKGLVVCNTSLQPGASFQVCYEGAELSLFEVYLLARLKPEGEIFGTGAGSNFGAPAVSACPVAGFHSVGGSATDKCKVPKVLGKTQASAESAIKKAGCKVGAVKRKHSSHVKKGHVISQGVSAGKSEPSGTKVALVVSKGK
jgi:hypothetical protein